MNTLLSAVVDKFWRGVVGMYFDLIHRWDNLAALMVEELLKVLDTEVGDADALDFTSWKLLHLLPAKREHVYLQWHHIWGKTIPCFDKVPVRQVL